MDSLENRPVFRVRLKTRIAESFPFFMRIEQGYFFAGLFCVRRTGSFCVKKQKRGCRSKGGFCMMQIKKLTLTHKKDLRKAYQMFLDRQLTCPCTMSNGDFLQWNVIYDGENVVMIDWGFGGMMPYSLDIARFLAHATETRSTFPFYMNDAQKELFLDRMYEALKTKISREQFNLDVKLATLNEYIEFVEAEEDEDGWYLEHAQALAEELLNL